jgi:hypothetical protein
VNPRLTYAPNAPYNRVLLDTNGQPTEACEELQLDPKCCGVPFGGAHSNMNYGLDSDGSSICIAANWGYIKINSIITIETGGSNSQPVNPLFCVGDSTPNCVFDPTSTPYTLQVAAVDLNPVPQVPARAAQRVVRLLAKLRLRPGFTLALHQLSPQAHRHSSPALASVVISQAKP